VAPSDGGRVDRRELELLVASREGSERGGRVEQERSAWREPLDHVGAEQARVEYEQVIGVIDLVAVGDGLVTRARVGAHRRSRTLTRVVSERLHAEALLGVRRREDLGARDASLTSATVQADLD